MALTRLIHLRHIYPDQAKFFNLAFNNTGGRKAEPGEPLSVVERRGAISTVDLECACPGDPPQDNCVCAHVAKWYRSFPEPVIYWIFDPAVLKRTEEDKKVVKEEVAVVPTPSESGDDCHRDIQGISDDRAWKRFKAHWKEGDSFICVDGKREPFSWERALELRAATVH